MSIKGEVIIAYMQLIYSTINVDFQHNLYKIDKIFEFNPGRKRALAFVVIHK
jgi:hypothetical protein